MKRPVERRDASSEEKAKWTPSGHTPKPCQAKPSPSQGTAPGYGFAFTPGEKGGAPVATRSLVWFVYEGKGIDYLPDEGVWVASTEGCLNTMRIM